MDFGSGLDWRQATAEDIDRAVNGCISAGTLVKTAASKTVLKRLLNALHKSCQINEANPLIRQVIYNLHREMDGQAPLESIDSLDIQVFNIFVPRGDEGGIANELYIMESGKIVRFAELNIDNDLFSKRLKDYFLELCREQVDF